MGGQWEKMGERWGKGKKRGQWQKVEEKMGRKGGERGKKKQDSGEKKKKEERQELSGLLKARPGTVTCHLCYSPLVKASHHSI